MSGRPISPTLGERRSYMGAKHIRPNEALGRQRGVLASMLAALLLASLTLAAPYLSAGKDKSLLEQFGPFIFRKRMMLIEPAFE